VVHATAVSFHGCGILIEGPSGSGKSALALRLMAHGAGLIADDRTRIGPDVVSGAVMLEAPEALPALIEARGIGLLPVTRAAPAPLRLVVELGRPAPGRLPEPETRTFSGQMVTLIRPGTDVHVAAAIIQWVKSLGEG